MLKTEFAICMVVEPEVITPGTIWLHAKVEWNQGTFLESVSRANEQFVLVVTVPQSDMTP